MLLMACGLPVNAQYFKVYFRQNTHDVPAVLTVKDLVPVANREWVIAGELKDPAPGYRARAYLFRVDPAGRPVLGASIYTNLNHSTNEVRVEDVAVGPAETMYVAGTSIQDPLAPVQSSGSERTLTAVSKTGEVLWSRMQPNHSFAGVSVDAQTSTLLALSGPDHGLPAASLMFTQLDLSGKFLQGFTLLTATEDEPIDLLQLPAGMGYLALGRADIHDARRPYLVRLGPDLEPIWQYTYTDGHQPTEVTGVAFHPDGYHVVCGSFLDDQGAAQPFLLGVNEEDGQVRFFHTFDFGGGFGARAHGVAAFRSQDEGGTEGMLLTGAWFETGKPAIRRSFVLLVDSEGQLRWARTYSSPPLTDLMEDEFLSVVRYEASSNHFLAAGTHTGFIGAQVYHRWPVLVRASAADGIVDVPGTQCESPLAVTLIPGDMVAHEVTVTRVYGGSIAGFGYFDEAIPLEWSYCAYGDGKALVDDSETTADSKPVFGRGYIGIPYAPGLRAGEARLIDLSGKQVRQIVLPPAHGYAELSLSGISAGIYLLRVEDGYGQVSIDKVRIP